MKVYAERNLKVDMKNNIFTLDYVEQAEGFTPNYLETIFEQTKKEFGKDRLFGKEERINLRANTIKSIIEKLEKYNLSGTSTDVKGIAFERFLGRTFRGEIGQFFTPRPIVEFMVQMIAPKEGDVICDPASGSGGFLINFFEIVREEIQRAVDGEYQSAKRSIEKDKALSEEARAAKLTEQYDSLQEQLNPELMGSRLWELANRCIYGTDANERMARTSKMNMIMHGDGHGGIHHHDGFLNVNGIFEGRFDVVLTNPPFGASVEESDTVVETQIETDPDTMEHYRKVYGEAYTQSQAVIKAAQGKPIASLFDLPKGNSIKTELLFIERCLSLLKPGGRLGIVLPEGVFNNPSLAYVRNFAEDRAFVSAIVSLPQETFTSSKAAVKTSLLFMRKFTEVESLKWLEALEQGKAAVLAEQEAERKELTASKSGKTRLKVLSEQVVTEGRTRARMIFDYAVFMCEPISVGITSTGETGPDTPTELPLILDEFGKFLAAPDNYGNAS